MSAGARTRKPREKQVTDTIAFRLREEDGDWIRRLAERDSITPSAVVRRIVERERRRQSERAGAVA